MSLKFRGKEIFKPMNTGRIDDIKIECFLVPGHTWGHMCYLIDDQYLFTGDTIWFGPDGGYSFLDALAEDNELAKRSLAEFEQKLRSRKLSPMVITGHTGWYDDLDWVFRHKDQVCRAGKKQKPHDPNAPYDGYDETQDTEEKLNTDVRWMILEWIRIFSRSLKPLRSFWESALRKHEKNG